MKKRVLVTGGAGFIGSHLVERLMKDPDVEKIRVVDNLSTGNVDNLNPFFAKGEFIYGNLQNTKIAKRAVKDIDVVFHLAAASDVQGSIINPLSWHFNGDHITLILLDAALKAGVSTFIFASSASVYKSSPEPSNEVEEPMPLSPYAVYKLNGEQYTKLFRHYGMSTASLRFFNVYGPRQLKGVIPNLCHSFIDHHPFIVNGDGRQSRDFIHVHDVVDLCVKAMSQPHNLQGDCFNVGTGKATTIHELVSCFEQAMNSPIPLLYNTEALQWSFFKDTPREIFHSQAYMENTKTMFEWEPKITLEEGLKDTVKFWKEKS